MQVFFPREHNAPLERLAFSQVAVAARPALYHDEFKLRLPAVIRPNHHLLFTLLHMDPAVRGDGHKAVSGADIRGDGYKALP